MLKKILNFILGKLQYLIVLFALYTVYENFYDAQQQIANKKNEIDVIKIVIQKSRKKLNQVQEFKKNMQAMQVRINETQKAIDNIQKQLPNVISDAEILDLFSHELKLVNILNPTLSPLEEFDGDYFVGKRYELTGEGTFLQFLVFFERISQKERIYNVKELKLAVEKEKNRGRFQIIKMRTVMEAYRYDSNSIGKIAPAPNVNAAPNNLSAPTALPYQAPKGI